MTERKSYFKEDGTLVFPLPEFMENMTVEEQIEHEIKIHRERHPEDTAMMAFTYDKNREPNIQRQVVEL